MKGLGCSVYEYQGDNERFQTKETPYKRKLKCRTKAMIKHMQPKRGFSFVNYVSFILGTKFQDLTINGEVNHCLWHQRTETNIANG